MAVVGTWGRDSTRYINMPRPLVMRAYRQLGDRNRSRISDISPISNQRLYNENTAKMSCVYKEIWGKVRTLVGD